MELMIAVLSILIILLVFCSGLYLNNNVIRPAVVSQIIDALGIDEIDYNKADGRTRVGMLEEKYQASAELLMRRAVRITHRLTQSSVLSANCENGITKHLEDAIFKLRTGEVTLVVFDNTHAIQEAPLRVLVDTYNTDARSLRRASRQLSWLLPQTFFAAWLYPQKL